MAEAADDLAKRWAQAATPSLRTNISEDIMKLTLRIAGETLCSLDISGEAEPRLTLRPKDGHMPMVIRSRA